ncbi:MAG TPA: type II secretion system protein [Dyella sp.]|nr:type II secretion system protein [Dyella sp.]
MRSSDRGFTLLETLVMLVVASLAVALMFQVLDGFNRARQRVAALEGVRNNRLVFLGWWRDSVESLVAVSSPRGVVIAPDDPASGLRGDAVSFRALTLVPLLGGQGRPVAVQWSLRDDDGHAWLEYRQPGAEPLAFDLGRAQASFAYQDARGERHAAWPVDLGVQEAMPIGIELVIRKPDDDAVVMQSIAADRPLSPPLYGLEAEQ